jgi:hypothetical protein
MITGAGSTGAETSVAVATSVADAVASFTAAMAVTSTVAEASTAVTHSAAAVATSMAEEAFMVDTVGADPMVAVMAVDTGKFLDSSTPPRRPAARSAGRFLFGLDSARNPRPGNAFVVAA